MFKKLLGIDKLEKKLETLENEKKELLEKLEHKEKSPKEIATENQEPWVAVIETGFNNEDKPGAGYFELDWNKYFIAQLVESGYSGRTDEEVIDQWFNDICRGVLGNPGE